MPVGYQRYLVEQRRVYTYIGDVYAKNYEDACALVAAGKVNFLSEARRADVPTITADPAEAGEGNHDEDQPHIHD